MLAITINTSVLLSCGVGHNIHPACLLLFRPWCDLAAYPLLLRIPAELLSVPLGFYSWIQARFRPFFGVPLVLVHGSQ